MLNYRAPVLAVALSLAACGFDDPNVQQQIRDLNDAQYGTGPRTRTCNQDADCYQDEACVEQGRQGVCVRRR